MISFGAWKKPFSTRRFQNHWNGRKEKIRTHSDLEMSSDELFLAPQVGLEPTTLRLTAECSAIELLRIIGADDLSSAPLESGDDLLSRAVASQVPSARRGLTSVFGMGTGGSLLPLSPEIVFNSLVCPFVQGSRLENHTGKADLEFTRSRMFACAIPAYAHSPLLCFLSSFQIKPSTD